MTEFTPQELEEIRTVFDKYDKNANGTLDWDEFCLLMDELIDDMALDEKSLAFNIVDRNHTGVISFEEFLEWWCKR